MGRDKPDPQQLVLPFRIEVEKLMRRRLGISPQEKHLLRVLLGVIGDKPKRQVYLRAQTYADAMEVSLRTVERSFRGLKRHDLVFKLRTPRKGLMCTTWGVSFARLWELSGVTPTEETTRQVVGSIPETTRQVVGSIESHIRNESKHHDALNKQYTMNHDHGVHGALRKNDGTDATALARLPDVVERWTKRQLSQTDLTDPDRIGELLAYAVAQASWPTNEKAELDFFTLCVHCAESAQVPGALMTAVVFRGKVARFTNAQEQRAEQLLLMRRRRQPKSEPLKAVVRSLASSLAAPVDRPTAIPTEAPRRSPDEIKAQLRAMSRGLTASQPEES